MKAHFGAVLDTITRVSGVRGAMIVAREDGLIVADSLMAGVRGNAVAALAASLAKRVGNASVASGAGEPQFLHLQGTDGVLLAVPAGADMLIVAIADPGVNVGLVRLELIRGAEVVQ